MVKAGLLEPQPSGLAQVPRHHGCYWTCEQVRSEYTQQVESGSARLPVVNGEAGERGNLQTERPGQGETPGSPKRGDPQGDRASIVLKGLK
jgi:hypothetical protein